VAGASFLCCGFGVFRLRGVNFLTLHLPSTASLERMVGYQQVGKYEWRNEGRADGLKREVRERKGGNEERREG